MNKKDLVGRIAEEAHLTRGQASKALDSVVHAIRCSLSQGDKVTLSGFGTFAVSNRKARTVRDPRNGLRMKIEEKRVARFAPGLELKMAVEQSAGGSRKREEDHSLHPCTS